MELQKKELIKDVNGYEGLYAVTSLGRIWSYRRNRWIKPWSDLNGYSRVSLCNKGHEANPTLHRLVAITYIQNPEDKPQVNHLNGDKADCRVENLDWVTARENLQHATDMGLNSIHKLSYEKKITICKMRYHFKCKQKFLAELFGVTASSISQTIKNYMPIILEAQLST